MPEQEELASRLESVHGRNGWCWLLPANAGDPRAGDWTVKTGSCDDSCRGWWLEAGGWRESKIRYDVVCRCRADADGRSSEVSWPSATNATHACDAYHPLLGRCPNFQLLTDLQKPGPGHYTVSVDTSPRSARFDSFP